MAVDRNALAGRLDGAPARVSAADIAEYTGRTAVNVRQWAKRPGFPVPVGERPSARHPMRLYDRNAVQGWLREHAHEMGRRVSGPAHLPKGVRGERVTASEAARRMGIQPNTMTSYLARDDSSNPAPQRGADGLLSWDEVRAWRMGLGVDQHDRMSEGWA